MVSFLTIISLGAAAGNLIGLLKGMQQSGALSLRDISVVQPKQSCRGNPNRSHRAPDQCRLMMHLTKLPEEQTSQNPAPQRSKANRQKRKTHVRALLAGWG